MKFLFSLSVLFLFQTIPAIRAGEKGHSTDSLLVLISNGPHSERILQARVIRILNTELKNLELSRNISVKDFVKRVHKDEIKLEEFRGLGNKGVEIIRRVVDGAGLSLEKWKSPDSMSAKIMSLTDVDFKLKSRALNILKSKLAPLGFSENTSVNEFFRIVKANEAMFARISGLGKKGREMIEDVVSTEGFSIKKAKSLDSVYEKVRGLNDVENSLKTQVLNVLKRNLEDLGFSESTSVEEFIAIVEHNQIELKHLSGLGKKGVDILQGVVDSVGLSIDKVKSPNAISEKILERSDIDRGLTTRILNALKNNLGPKGFSERTSVKEFVKMVEENDIKLMKLSGLGQKGLDVIEGIIDPTRAFANTNSFLGKIRERSGFEIKLKTQTINALKKSLGQFGLAENTTVDEFIRIVEANKIKLEEIPQMGKKGLQMIQRILGITPAPLVKSKKTSRMSDEIMKLSDIHSGAKVHTLNALKRSLDELGFNNNTSVGEFVDLIEDNRLNLDEIPDLGPKGLKIIDRIFVDTGFKKLNSRGSVYEKIMGLNDVSSSLKSRTLNALRHNLEAVGFSEYATVEEFVKMIEDKKIRMEKLPLMGKKVLEIIESMIADAGFRKLKSSDSVFEKVMGLDGVSITLKSRTLNVLKDNLWSFGFNDNTTVAELVEMIDSEKITLERFPSIGEKSLTIVRQIISQSRPSLEIPKSPDSMVQKIVDSADVHRNTKSRTLNALNRKFGPMGFSENTSVEDFVKMVQENEVMLEKLPLIGENGFEMIRRILGENGFSYKEDLTCRDKVNLIISLHK